uniref:NGFI-A binding protein 2 n=1 Tax=Sphenodon punctatus TaxID=8508 RepID=A0A8D0H3E7_SPHPU
MYTQHARVYSHTLPPPPFSGLEGIGAPAGAAPSRGGVFSSRSYRPRNLPRAEPPAMALPRTLGELQLYRVLQRANLLSYYETFIQQGGDDVQQLCEAGEEEFLEIMALVGMDTKPLHVRRLQKALREWATNPGLFNQPVPSVPVSSIPLFKISESGGRKALSNGHASPGEAPGKASSTSPARSPLDLGEKLSPLPATHWGTAESEEEGGVSSPGEHPSAPEQLEPEVARAVTEGVERLLRSCPRGGGNPSELRALMKLNKKLAKAVGHIFRMEDGDPRKEEEIRRHSAIYGRGEGRRREGKQLTLHELTINEAAAQFCLRDTSLLLRRVELFSLSRQVARESTYLSSLKGARLLPDEGGAGQAKRLKQEVGEPSRPDLPSLCDPFAPQFRPSLDEDAGSLSGESLDGHPQGECVRAPGVDPGLGEHGRRVGTEGQQQQQSWDPVSSSHTRFISDFEDEPPERCQPLPPAQPETRRSSIKLEPESSRQ